MLTNQVRLHQLLRKQRPSTKEREEIVKLLRNGKYDLPECVFQNVFTLLKHNNSFQQRFFNVKDLILSGLQLKIGVKLKGYLKKFKQALGEVPFSSKLTALVDYVTSNQATQHHFQDCIHDDSTDYDSKKLAIGVAKATYQWDQYVAKLNEYLKQNPNDGQAWMQLGDIYAQKSQYLRALFCYQQVVILHPQNDYYFVRLAELYYTDGGKNNLSTAVQYFSYVISRNPNNVRALWGLWRSLWAQRDSLDEQDQELMAKTKQAIQKLYNKKNPKIKIHQAL